MSAIYIHIPYCKKKCSYCNFHFSISQSGIDEMINSIVKELKLRKNYLNSEIKTIYFGGGTPSILNKKHLEKLFDKIRSTFNVSENAEISFECNPDDLNKEKLILLKYLGVNRLSIGIQSFDDKDLKFMNRSHNSDEAINSVKLAQEVGFDNISIDLIYSLPSQSVENWQKNLEIAFSLNIQHISSYSLTIEKNTQLSHLIKTKKITELDEKTSSEHFNLLLKESKKNEFIQYEISNFGKEGYFSKHNSSYWENKNYLGIGPSAHSYNGESRSWNISNNKNYIEIISENKLPSETEILTKNQKYNEYIFTSLRTMWGVDLKLVQEKFDEKIYNYLLLQVVKWKETSDILHTKNTLKLTEKGKLLADAIASDLFIV